MVTAITEIQREKAGKQALILAAKAAWWTNVVKLIFVWLQKTLHLLQNWNCCQYASLHQQIGQNFLTWRFHLIPKPPSPLRSIRNPAYKNSVKERMCNTSPRPPHSALANGAIGKMGKWEKMGVNAPEGKSWGMCAVCGMALSRYLDWRMLKFDLW